MEDESAKEKLEGIVRTDSQAIARSSASLMRRSLRSLSESDEARGPEVAEALVEKRTGLYKSCHIDFILETEMSRSVRYGYEFSLIYVEVDQFRDVASSLSCLACDRLLAEMGEMVKATLRRIDWGFFYREGEFVFILPQASKETACIMARCLHSLVRGTIWLAQDEGLLLTASVGVATYPTDAQTKIDLLHRADEALYLVKNSTGNGIAIANIGILQPLG